MHSDWLELLLCFDLLGLTLVQLSELSELWLRLLLFILGLVLELRWRGGREVCRPLLRCRLCSRLLLLSHGGIL